MCPLTSILERIPVAKSLPACRRHHRIRTASLFVSAILTCQSSLNAAPSIFDDDWKPPAEPRALDQPPTSAPAAPAAAPRPSAPRLSPWNAPSTAPAEPPPRAAIPDPAAIAAAEKKVKAAYRTEYAGRTADKKAALARSLLNEAQHRGTDPAVLYVLLEEARNLAAANGEPEVAVDAARGTRDAFQLSSQAARELEQSALWAAIGSLPAAMGAATAHRAADLAMQLAEYDMEQGEYGAAVQVARQAMAAERKTGNTEYSERVSTRVARIEAVDAEYEQDKDAIAGLKVIAADQTANLAAGRFHAFYLDEPEVGLPFLAKGLDPVLRSLASGDQAAGGAASAGTPPPRNQGAAEQLAVAEAWADGTKFPPAADPVVKDAMQRRAIFWYDQAANSASGAIAASARQKARDLRSRRAMPGLAGEYYRGQDFGYRLFARADPTLEFTWSGTPPEFLMGGENFSVRWSGFIKGRSGRYKLIAVHNDGVRVWLDGQLVIDKWGANVGRESASVELAGQLQELKVEYTQHTGGSYLGLGWVTPGEKRAVPVPADALFHDPLPPGPVYAAAPRPDRDGKIDLTAAAAIGHGAIRFVQAGKSAAHLDQWAAPDDWAGWDFEAVEGDYDIDVLYSCDDQRAGGTYSLSIDNNVLSGTVQSTGGWNDYHAVQAGRVRLAQGLQSMRLKATRMPHAPLWHLSEIVLTPAKDAK